MKCYDTKGKPINIQGIDTSHNTAMVVENETTIVFKKIKKLIIEFEKQ